jgi:hypothetical protein
MAASHAPASPLGFRSLSLPGTGTRRALAMIAAALALFLAGLALAASLPRSHAAQQPPSFLGPTATTPAP